jgi:hypothetical protein
MLMALTCLGRDPIAGTRRSGPNQFRVTTGMKINYRVWFLIAGLCFTQQSGIAQSKPLELKWSELAAMINGYRVVISLPGNATVAGDAVAVRQDTLVIDVTKSSGQKHYATGNAEIPRNEIGLIKLQRTRGAWGRTLGTVIGAIGGMGIGGYSAAHTSSPGPGISVFVGVTSATTVAGYYAGRSLDRRETLIRIVP